ncbi:hypothetical protein ES703_101402 [subsurface metagenome]
MGEGSRYQAKAEAGSQDTKYQPSFPNKPVRDYGSQRRHTYHAQADRHHYPEEEVELPLSRSQAAQGHTSSHNASPHRENQPGLNSIYQSAYHRRHQPVDHHLYRKHQRSVASPPAKLLHNGRIKHGEGIPEGIADRHDDKSYSYDDPTVEEPRPLF